MAFFFEARVLVVEIPNNSTDNVFSFNKDVWFLQYFVQLNRRASGCLQNIFSLHLMVVMEDWENISCKRRRVLKNFNSVNSSGAREGFDLCGRHYLKKKKTLAYHSKVCDLLTLSNFVKLLHKALFIQKVQRHTCAYKIITPQNIKPPHIYKVLAH